MPKRLRGGDSLSSDAIRYALNMTGATMLAIPTRAPVFDSCSAAKNRTICGR